ncbi:hypothetical protein [Brucella intermedia]|uniref:hypothetical protein n=1 Tax=Brucella intermedia TaxID=94625 RepID=UPI002360C1C2|nr:hypothetical protein [Brucella intermedia]
MTKDHFFLDVCPFCGGNDVDLANTWTPSFWVECEDCSAQVHGEAFEGPDRKDRFSYAKEPSTEFEATFDQLYPEYQQAALSAINAWNRRIYGWQPIESAPETGGGDWLPGQAPNNEVVDLLFNDGTREVECFRYMKAWARKEWDRKGSFTITKVFIKEPTHWMRATVPAIPFRTDYDAADDAKKCYDLAVEEKRKRGDTHWPERLQP